MKELLLDAETLYTREQLHDVLTKVCGFPAVSYTHLTLPTIA